MGALNDIALMAIGNVANCWQLPGDSGNLIDDR